MGKKLDSAGMSTAAPTRSKRKIATKEDQRDAEESRRLEKLLFGAKDEEMLGALRARGDPEDSEEDEDLAGFIGRTASHAEAGAQRMHKAEDTDDDDEAEEGTSGDEEEDEEEEGEGEDGADIAGASAPQKKKGRSSLPPPAAPKSKSKSSGDQKRQPVWVDEDDEALVVNVASKSRLRKLRSSESETLLGGKDYIRRLRAQHAKLNTGTSWAKLGHRPRPKPQEDDEEGQDGDLDRLEGGGRGEGEAGAGVGGGEAGASVEELEERVLLDGSAAVVGRGVRLPKGMLAISRCEDANQAEPSEGVVQSTQFHPNGQLLMTAGLDKHLRFFQVDGKDNPKVQSVFLEDLPISRAAFVGADGGRVLAAGGRRWFYMYDLGAARVERVSRIVGREERELSNFVVSPDGSLAAFLGSDGYTLLMSLHSRQLVGTLKAGGGAVRAAAWAAGGAELATVGDGGEVLHWDVRMQRCFHRGVDDGCLHGTAIAASRDAHSDMLATGSDAGVVNLYRRPDFLASPWAAPVRSLMNLTTDVDLLTFNHDGQMLAMGSSKKRDAFRVVHLPSATVFSNWPASRTPMHYVSSVDFSPNSGYMAVGNARGKVLLYRLLHYSQS